ncbi:MAG: type II toxin-antitoxin system VapC family toxin [Halapricum sp.]
MPRALVDTSVLFAAGYRRDSAHNDALPILTGIDTADLPEGVVLDYVLAETLNGLSTHAGHSAAVDFLDRLEENTRFHIDSLTADGFATAKGLFRQYEQFSFVDSAIVAYMQAEGLGYLYAFDDDFDVAEEVYRLETATNPYRPDRP